MTLASSLSYDGAEGFGRFATGGRGGDVVKVTTSADSGVGSFRWAVEQLGGPRYVVFEVNEVNLDEDVGVVNGDVTIAGQTAGGVEISGGTVKIRDSNVIMQGVKIRPGDKPGEDPLTNRDAIAIADNNERVSDIMISHNSFQWAPDELVYIGNNVENLSLNNNIIAQSLHDPNDSQIGYGKGMLIQEFGTPKYGSPELVTIAGNLFAFNYDRNPRIEEASKIEFINNFIYSPGHQHWATDVNANENPPASDLVITNNLYKGGPDTTEWKDEKPFIRNGSDKGVYIADNLHVDKYGNIIDEQWHGSGSTVNGPTFNGSGVGTLRAADVEAYVLGNAGAMPGDRDPVDQRIIDAVTSERSGIVDSPGAAGGYENVAFSPAQDSDNDGMPDWYENQKGLNKNSFNPNGDADGNGYTNLEDYIFGLLQDYTGTVDSGSGGSSGGSNDSSGSSGSSGNNDTATSDDGGSDSGGSDSGASVSDDGSVIGSVRFVGDMTHVERTVDFGAPLEDAVVFATPATLDGTDPVTTRISGLSDTSVTLRLDEPNYLDENHTTENVSVVALEKGVFDLGGGRRLEVGTVDTDALSSGAFTSVSFTSSFDEAPVVVAQIQTDNGPDWVVPRLDDIDANGFKVAMQETEANNNGYHVEETIGWLAIEADVFDWATTDGSVDTQAFMTGRTVDDDGATFDFASAVGDSPRLAAGLASFFGPDTTNLRLAELGGGRATFVADEEQSADAETSHTEENVAGLAFENDALLTGSELFIA